LFSKKNEKKFNSIGKLNNIGKHILSYNENCLTIIDPFNHQVLKDEKFASPFLLNFNFGQNGAQEKTGDFCLLFQDGQKIENYLKFTAKGTNLMRLSNCS